jgi:hypothetical protein
LFLKKSSKNLSKVSRDLEKLKQSLTALPTNDEITHRDGTDQLNFKYSEIFIRLFSYMNKTRLEYEPLLDTLFYIKGCR